MQALLRKTMLIMFAWLLFSGVCLAKQVYMRNGEVIDCESFRKSGDQVIVKINRDIVLYFDPQEVNLGKTFHPGREKNSRHKRRRKAAASARMHNATDAVPAKQIQAPPAPVAALPVAAAPAAPAKSDSKKAEPAAPAPLSVVEKARRAAAAVAVRTSPTPDGKPAAKKEPNPEPGESASANAGSGFDPTDFKQRSRENMQMLSEATSKHDPALLVKALKEQFSLLKQQKNAVGQGGIPTAVLGSKYLVFLLVVTLLIVISMWSIFERAGRSGFGSLIPVYNLYVLMQVSKKPGWWLILLFVPVLGLICYLLAMLSLAGRFGKGALFGLGLVFLPMIFFPVLAFGGGTYEV